MKQNVEEQLAVLNELGNPTGETVSREEAHRKGTLHGASHLWIYRQNQNGRIDILLQRRSANKDSFPNCLDISSAGHMVADMNFEETAQKELAEELGISVDLAELEYAFTQRISQRSIFNGKRFLDNEINKIYLLNRDVDISSLRLQEEEVSEVMWMDTEEIARRIGEGDKEICLSKEEYNGVLSNIKKRLQKKPNNRLSYLKVKVGTRPSLSETKPAELDAMGR